jgi:hypothetical protein
MGGGVGDGVDWKVVQARRRMRAIQARHFMMGNWAWLDENAGARVRKMEKHFVRRGPTPVQ